MGKKNEMQPRKNVDPSLQPSDPNYDTPIEDLEDAPEKPLEPVDNEASEGPAEGEGSEPPSPITN